MDRVRRFLSNKRNKNMSQFVIFLLVSFMNSFCETKFDDLRKRLALEAIIANPMQSLVVSPLLVRFSLCKLASVSSGYLRNELMTVLGINSDDRLQNCYMNLKDVVTPLKDIDVIFLNQIIVNYTDDVDPHFVTNGTDYGVKVDKIGFNFPSKAVSFVNRWVERATLNRITRILEPTDVNNKTSILAISAAYFKVTWEFPFDIRLTKDMKFRHHDGNISIVPMMSKTGTYFYLKDDLTSSQCINIKLASFGLSMTILIPQTFGGLEKFLNQMSNDQDFLKSIYNRMRFQTVNLMLPRFKIKSTIEWNKYFEKIGLKQLFNESESGLNRILRENSKVKKMYLDKVKQRSFIDVDEMGIFRQAPVREFFDGQYFQRDSSFPQMIADRPFYFIFALQADKTNSLDMHELFTGVYYGPDY